MKLIPIRRNLQFKLNITFCYCLVADRGLYPQRLNWIELNWRWALTLILTLTPTLTQKSGYNVYLFCLFPSHNLKNIQSLYAFVQMPKSVKYLSSWLGLIQSSVISAPGIQQPSDAVSASIVCERHIRICRRNFSQVDGSLSNIKSKYKDNSQWFYLHFFDFDIRFSR